MIEIASALVITLSALKIVKDYNAKKIKTTTMFTYEIIFLISLCSVFNKKIIQIISEFLGFEVASNFILLVLVITVLWANYVNQTKIRKLEMQMVKISRFIAINGSKFEN
jgi:hypothetical protein